MADRAKFSPSTKDLLAQRAGYQCSVLNCGQLTIGAGPGPRDVEKIGMACHIYSAADDGPRGTGGLSIDERSAPENGIWCCYRHGKLIDNDNGTRYPAITLKAWKRLHEARKGGEVMGIPTDRFGLVESISINSGPAQLHGRKFELGMRNLIIGPNESGKTILTRLIASVANPHYVAAMSQHREVDIAVKWFDPSTHEVKTKGRNGNVSHVFDGQSVPYVARPFKTIQLSGTWSLPLTLPTLAQMLDLNVAAVKATANLLPGSGGYVKDVNCRGDDIDFIVEVDGHESLVTSGHHSSQAYAALAVLELAAAHAKHHASSEPTLLIVDEFLDIYFHSKLQTAAIERLHTAAESAQVAVVSHSIQVLLACQKAWTVAELGSSGNLAASLGFPIDIEVT